MSSLQQVNLFLPEFRLKKGKYQFVSMLTAWTAVIVFLTFVQLWVWNQTQHTREQLADINVEQIKVLQQLKTLRDSAPRNTKAQMQRSIDNLQAEVKQQQQLLSVIKGQSIGNTEGFSEYLLSLSRQHMDGLSLDHFQFLDSGDYVELSGWTHKPELVPDYIQRLRSEDSFKNTRFGEMSIERIAAQRADALKFALGSADGGGS